MNAMYWMLGGLGGILALHFIVKFWPRSPRARFLHEYAALQRDMVGRGLSPAQQQQEFTFRYGMADFRDRLSAAALVDPSCYRRKMVELAAEIAKSIAATDADVAKRFVKVVDTAMLSDVLTPEALSAVDRWLAQQAPTGFHDSPEVFAKAIAASRTI